MAVDIKEVMVGNCFRDSENQLIVVEYFRPHIPMRANRSKYSLYGTVIGRPDVPLVRIGINYVSPIDLSEEWLILMGFSIHFCDDLPSEYQTSFWCVQNHQFLQIFKRISPSGTIEFHFNPSGTVLKYVHQVQNLCTLLIGFTPNMKNINICDTRDITTVSKNQ